MLSLVFWVLFVICSAFLIFVIPLALTIVSLFDFVFATA